MNSNTTIKILLGSTHLNSHAKALQDLRTPLAQNMQPDNLFLLALHNQLEARRLLIRLVHNTKKHVREAGIVHLDIVVAEFLSRFRLREADGADLRVREDDGGDVGVV